jgi:hypothetical protein
MSRAGLERRDEDAVVIAKPVGERGCRAGLLRAPSKTSCAAEEKPEVRAIFVLWEET